MITFYYAPNTIALATHIALETVGAEYKLVRIDFSKSEQRSAEYLKINPKARVPALMTDHGVLTETPAMLLYVCQCFPEANLAPLNDVFALAQVNAFNSYLCSTVHVAHAHRMRGYRWVDANDSASIAAMQKKVPHSVSECFELMEREMFKAPWVMGNQYTICDMYLFTLAQWCEADGVDIGRYQNIAEHREIMSGIPAVCRAVAAENAAP